MKVNKGILLIIFSILSASLSAKDSVDDDVIVYPNPVTNGSVQVESKRGIIKVELVSIIGKVIDSSEHDGLKSAEVKVDLKAGLYLLKIFFADNTTSVRRLWVN